MKKMFFLLVIATCAAVNALAQTSFKPVLSEGKSWQVAVVTDRGNFPTDKEYSITVSGDTIVNGLECKKIVAVLNNESNSTITAVAREDSGKVWNVKEDGSESLLFDLNLKEGDGVDAGYVLKVDYISVNGSLRKRQMIDSGIDGLDYLYYVVEGVGINTDKLIKRLGLTQEGQSCRMISCVENGKTIFTGKDFEQPAYGYTALVREGVKWKYAAYRYHHETQIKKFDRFYTLEFDGTEEIDGKEYGKLYQTDYDIDDNVITPARLVAYVHDDNGAITMRNVSHWYYDEEYSLHDVDSIYNFSNPKYLPEEIAKNDMFGNYELVTAKVREGDPVDNVERSYTAYQFNDGDDIMAVRIFPEVGADSRYGDFLMPTRDFKTGGADDMAGLVAFYKWRNSYYKEYELAYKGCMWDDVQELLKNRYAEDYVSLIREGVVWENYVTEEYSNPSYIYTTEFSGEEEVDGKTYKKLYRTTYDHSMNLVGTDVAALIREKDQVVYCRILANHMEYPIWTNHEPDFEFALYDFNVPSFLPPYDEMTSYAYPNTVRHCTVQVGDGQNLASIINEGREDELKVIMGIGADGYSACLTSPLIALVTGMQPIPGLAAVYENGVLVYKGYYYDEAKKLKDMSGISDVEIGIKAVSSVRYYNLQGVESAVPFQGVNIVVTTHSDGSRTATKQIH